MRALLGAVLLLCPIGLNAQAVKCIPLKPATATLDADFVGITSLREIAHGRVIVTDGRNTRRLQCVGVCRSQHGPDRHHCKTAAPSTNDCRTDGFTRPGTKCDAVGHRTERAGGVRAIVFRRLAGGRAVGTAAC